MSSEDTQLPLASPDPAADLLAQLRAAAPQVFSEGRVDFDKLKAALGSHIDQSPERYGLNWAGKGDAFRNVRAPSVGTLLPMPEESINWDQSENLIIEGDNLEVLKLLQKSYHGKVKMIYIDPPYNTGKEFIYPDNFHEGLNDYLRYSRQIGEDGLQKTTDIESSGRYHSKWLSMMYPRLFLARNLLRDDGVIFVSINDKEIHNLLSVLNELFGDENFIATLIWDKGHSAQAGIFKAYHEYILVFAKNLEHVGIPTATNNDIFEAGALKRESSRHPLQEFEFPAGVRFEAPDGTEYTGTWGGAEKVQVISGRFVAENGKTKYPVTLRAAFTQANQMKQYFYGDRGALVDSRGQQVVEFFFNSSGKLKILKQRGVFTPATTLSDYGTQSKASTELASLFGASESPLDNPKSPAMLKDFVKWFSDEGDLILDFFAGSGTTAQSVLELNQENEGGRKFILVQLPEKVDRAQYSTIADITRERVRRAIAKLDQEDSSKKSSRGFRAFKLSSSNFRIWNANRTPDDPVKLAEQLQLYADNSGHARSEQNVLYELILKSGLPLSCKVAAVTVAGTSAWSVDDSKLLILLNKMASREVLRAMIALQPQQMLCLDAAFKGDDALKTSIVLEARSHGITFRTI